MKSCINCEWRYICSFYIEIREGLISKDNRKVASYCPSYDDVPIKDLKNKPKNLFDEYFPDINRGSDVDVDTRETAEISIDWKNKSSK